MKSPHTVAAVILQVADEGVSWRNPTPEERYIHPSSLAKGCMLYVARELMGMPKPELAPRVQRILDVGTEGHRRILRSLRKLALAQEVFFQDDEHRIRGYCDAILYIPPSLDGELAGFYALEVKTAGSQVYERIVDEGRPREDHARQCQIYMWGLERYYGGAIPLRGGVVLYENRDTLEQTAFQVACDEAGMADLLSKVKVMLSGMREGRLPQDHLPLDHWAHRYCPYLDICEVGQQAMEYQKEHRQPLPDEVLAQIIGQRIVRKRRREGQGKSGRRRERSLEELVAEFDWN